MEKAHQMGYAALGDSAGERKDRQTDEGDAMNANALHAAVIAALNNPAVRAVDVVSEVRAATAVTVKLLAETAPLEKLAPPV